MKILAIRGKNLASLAGDFEIDFAKGPLAESGLFAITGPTGSGKSTLLDALCLALFDETPRLNFARGPEIWSGAEESERLKSNDVRSLLRRGAVEASAEVDFVGRDGRPWRATWSVGRARGKKTGRIQAQTVSLVSLDTNEAEGGTKTESLTAIVDKLGLTFDQFRKSVLLAQGDFAEFLKADAADRSQLLQRMTGTEIYEQVSRTAHVKAKEVKDRLESLRLVLESLSILTDEERATLEGEAADAAAKEKTLQARERLLEELQRRCRGARELEEAARRKTDEAQKAEQEAVAAEAQTRKAAEDVKASMQALEEAKTAREVRRPELEKARALDVRVEEAARALGQASKKEEEGKRRLDEALEEARKSQIREEKARKALTDLETWLKENEASRLVAEKWDSWERNLTELAATANETSEATEKRDAAARALTEANGRLSDASSRLEKLETELRDTASKRKDAEARHAAVPAATHRERLATLGKTLELIARLESVADRARAAVDEKSEAEREIASATEELARRREEESDAKRRLALFEPALPEAKLALTQLEAAMSLDDRRGELMDGKPCPLCGSTEHPWAKEGAPLESAVHAQRDRVRDLEKDIGKHREDAGRSDVAAVAEEKRVAGGSERAKKAAEKLAASVVAWTTLTPGLAGSDLSLDPADEAVRTVLERRRGEGQEEQKHLAAELTRHDDLGGEVRDLLKAEELFRGEQQNARGSLEEVSRKLQETATAQDRAAERLEALAAAAARELDLLLPVLSGRPELASIAGAMPGAVRVALKEEADAFVRKSEKAAEGRLEVATAEAAVLEKRSVAEERGSTARGLAEETRGLTEARDKLREVRRTLLEGRPAEDIEKELETDLLIRETVLGEQRQDAGKASTGASGSRATAKAAAEVSHDASERARKETADLTKALEESGAGTGEADVDVALADARASLEMARGETTAKEASRIHDDANKTKRTAKGAELEAERKASEVWLTLDALIGSSTGDKFRKFAQSLTLEALVQATNVHLKDLARRYALERIPGTDMDLQVIDTYMGDEPRSVNSLSGGETFLVSLALALGLSSLATRRTRIESLFIDEGFGALDSDTLEKALAALDALQGAGRRIGIVSHVTALNERIGLRVAVIPDGSGRSKVSVIAA
jgi:exonuclease SbcC